MAGGVTVRVVTLDADWQGLKPVPCPANPPPAIPPVCAAFHPEQGRCVCPFLYGVEYYAADGWRRYQDSGDSAAEGWPEEAIGTRKRVLCLRQVSKDTPAGASQPWRDDPADIPQGSYPAARAAGISK